MSRVGDALAQIEVVRSYTRDLIDTFAAGDWFKMPAEGVTHLAWQVGHLASAEYFLCLTRVRGLKPEDENDFELYSNDSLIGAFAKVADIVAAGSFVISGIALLAAGVGIMNRSEERRVGKEC